MITYTSLPRFRAATKVRGVRVPSACAAAARLAPRPTEGGGGRTVAANLVRLCDSWHYSVHRLLYHLATGVDLGPIPRRAQVILAQRGYAACQAAGTVEQIPTRAER